MITRVLSFRLPTGWDAQLDRITKRYGFASRGELLRLVLTDAAFNGKKIKGGTISPPTVVLGCRLPVAALKAIQEASHTQLKDTPSLWAGLAVYWWYQALQKEDSKQQKKNPIGYRFFIEDYAKHFRNRVAVYNRNMGINGGNNDSATAVVR